MKENGIKWMNMLRDFGYWWKINFYNFERNPIFCSHTGWEPGRYDFRAVNVLKEVDYILCEDTRTSEYF
jgi:hypothetical protein